MKKPFLISLTALAVLGVTTATTLYAQTTTGSSVIARMKAAAANFTLTELIPTGQTSLTSAPLVGKKTGDILTAGEYNRLLELISEGNGTGGSLQISFKKDYSKDGNSSVPATENIGSHDFCALTRYGEGQTSDSTAGYCKVEKWTDGTWTVNIQALNNNINCQVTCFKWSSGGNSGNSSSTWIGTPDYQSDWIDFGLAGNPTKKKFTHNLGTENYMIQMEGKGPGGDNNNCPTFIGADSSNSWLMNSGYWYYYDKNSTSVSVANYTNSLGRCSRYIRIKLWKYPDPTIAPASTVTNL